jgi:hypothetical protein
MEVHNCNSALRKLMQENGMFEASLDYTERYYLKKQKKKEEKSRMWWCIPILKGQRQKDHV